MAIRTSASQEVRRLVLELLEPRPDPDVRQEAAIARLAVIGTRAVRQVVDAYQAHPEPQARELLLRAMEAIPDPRVIDTVLEALEAADDGVRTAAARAARGLLTHPRGTRLLDTLTAIAMDQAAAESVRVAAIEAIWTLSARTVRPLEERLARDPSPAVRRAIERAAREGTDPLADLEEASHGWLPRDPQAVLQLLARTAPAAPLSTLHRLIEKVRSREEEGRARRTRDWRSIRGQLHLALARRSSRVALYDLREAFEAAEEPLPGEFLEAMALIGDVTCLDALAAAYVHAHVVPDGEHWRRALGETFWRVAAREGVTRRHGAIRRLTGRFGAHLAPLLEFGPRQ